MTLYVHALSTVFQNLARFVKACVACSCFVQVVDMEVAEDTDRDSAPEQTKYVLPRILTQALIALASVHNPCIGNIWQSHYFYLNPKSRVSQHYFEAVLPYELNLHSLR